MKRGETYKSKVYGVGHPFSLVGGYINHPHLFCLYKPIIIYVLIKNLMEWDNMDGYEYFSYLSHPFNFSLIFLF